MIKLNWPTLLAYALKEPCFPVLPLQWQTTMPSSSSTPYGTNFDLSYYPSLKEPEF